MLLGQPVHPALLLATMQSCCPIHGTAGLVSPSPNQLLLGSFQRFCCRGAGTGSKASKCKWVDVSPDPSPNLGGDSWSRHLAYWHKLSSFSPLNSLPGSSRTPGSPHQGRSFGITSAQLENQVLPSPWVSCYKYQLFLEYKKGQTAAGSTVLSVLISQTALKQEIRGGVFSWAFCHFVILNTNV